MRATRVGAVVIVCLMVVTAVPAQVGAASGTLVVGSQHDTQAEFSNAQELTNLTTTSSGDGAVELSGNVLEDFESGDLSGYSGSTSSFEVNSDPPVAHGTQSLKATTTSTVAISNTGLTASQGDTITYRVTPANVGTSQYAGFYFGANSAPSGTTIDGYRVTIGNGGNIYLYQDSSGGSATLLDSDESISLSADTTYRVEIAWGTDGSITVTIFEGSTQITQLTATDSTYTSGGIGFRTDENQGAAWDYVTKNGGTPESARYVSEIHNVSNAEQAAINITQASNVSINATVRTTGGTVLNQTTLTSTGNHTLTLADTSSDQLETVLNVSTTGDNPQFELADESILFNNDAPVVDDSSASPSGGEKLSSKGATLSIDVNDSQFGTAQGESLTVEFQTKGPDDSSFSTVATTTVNSNGTASATVSDLAGGTHDWRAIVTDDYGSQTTSQTFSFKVPSELRLFNVSDPSTLVQTNTNVTVRFYADDRIVEKTTTDGTVNLTGLPVSQTMVVQVNAPDYVERTVVIESIYEQQDFYLLNSSKTTASVEFTLDDKTGQFPASSTRLAVERPVTKDFDGDGADETRWKIVAADYFDAAKEFSTTLEDNSRYRLRVKNDAGDTRILGSYSTNGNSAERLPIGEVVLQPDATKGYSVEASITETDNGDKYIRLVYTDGEDLTDELTYNVTERDNASNVIVSNTTVTGPFGEFSVLIDIPDGDTAMAYKVNVWPDRDGETLSETRYVGAVPPIVENFDIDPKWASPLAWVAILGITGFVVIYNTNMAPMAGTGMAVMMTMIGAVAIPTPLLAGAAGLSILGAVAGGGS